MKGFNKTQLINKKRTFSRLLAVQILYQYEFFERKNDVFKLKDELIDNYALFEDEKEKSYRSKIDEKLTDELVEKTLENLEKIDEDIKKYQKNDDLDLITQQILRIGTAELKYLKESDLKIIVTEYCDIAGLFYDEAKIGFVASILNKLAK